MPEHEPVRAARCVLDADRSYAAIVGKVCRWHHERLTEMLDPAQTGQVFARPGERRIAASVAVLYGSLDPQPVRRAMDSQALGGAFGSTPPGRLDIMSLRDRRSGAADDANLWSVLGTLTSIATRLDLRDIDGRPVPVPGTVEGVCTWLHLRLDHLCAAEWVDDAFHDLQVIHRQLRTAAGDPPPRRVGLCDKRVNDDGKLAEDGPWECGKALYLPAQALKGMDEVVTLPESLRCTGCGWTYTRGELVTLAQRRVREARAAAEQVSA